MNRYYTITLSEEDRNKIKGVCLMLDCIVEELSEFPDDRMIIIGEDGYCEDTFNISTINQVFSCLLSLRDGCIHVGLTDNEFVTVDETFVS